MSEKRFKKAEAAAWLGIFGNLALALMKGAVGLLSGSKALLADAANSASDVAGSFAVLIGLKAAKLPPDRDHPYGHGKAESIAAIIVSVLLMLVGIELAINAGKAIYRGVTEAPEWYALIALAVSIIVKEALFHYNHRLGKRLSSQALIAGAWDHRTDVFASLAAFVGVAGALYGAWKDVPWMFYLDPIAGILVAGLVIRVGYKLLMDSIHNTMDHVLHKEDSEELLRSILRIKGVLSVDDLRAREHGHYIIVDVKISVNPQITVLEGHDIAKAVKTDLMDRFSQVSDVFVHVNPYDPGYPYKNHVDPEQDDRPGLLH